MNHSTYSPDVDAQTRVRKCDCRSTYRCSPASLLRERRDQETQMQREKKVSRFFLTCESLEGDPTFFRQQSHDILKVRKRYVRLTLLGPYIDDVDHRSG